MSWAWADPIRQAAAAAARAHGTRVVEMSGFATRGHGTTQGRLLGTMWHDTVTGSNVSQQRLFELLRDGYTGLPGPIANVGLDRDGTLGLIAAGRAYHAGSGSWPGIPSGNLNSCGLEVANSGHGSGEKWTPIQLAVARTFTRELHRNAGLSADRLVGHGAPSSRRPPNEWTTRKVDPWSISMSTERRSLTTPAIARPEDDELTPEQDKMLREVHRMLKTGKGAFGRTNAGHDLRETRYGLRFLAWMRRAPIRHDHDVPDEMRA